MENLEDTLSSDYSVGFDPSDCARVRARLAPYNFRFRPARAASR